MRSEERSATFVRYWKTRIRSAAFKRTLVDRVRDELRSISAERIEDVLDSELVRRVIREFDTRVIDRETVADLVIQGNRRMTRRLERRTESLLDLLDPELVAGLEALVEQQARLAPREEEFIAQVMRQEFMGGLFTDLIYSALVSFYRRVDPLFGGLAVRALEAQIKAFIRFFMPMVEKRATAFAIAADNRQILARFARAIVRELLGVPLRRYATLASSGPRRSAEAFIRRAARSPKLGAQLREATLAAWDDLYAAIRHRTVGDLLPIDEQAPWLAEQCVEFIVSALSRPRLLEFLAAEVAEAVGSGAGSSR